MLLREFDFELPDELIAQEALAERAASRMMVVNRNTESVDESMFAAFPSLLTENDVLVVNNTKVFPARLFGRTETGARVEIFLVRNCGDDIWESLARPARRLKPGKRVHFADDFGGEIVEKNDEGRVFIRFEAGADFDSLVETHGRTPLPPYIKRSEADLIDADRARYQTVYAKSKGSIAAPTAGLHFTREVIGEIKERGTAIAEITLHVGYGTFEPVRVDDLAEHRVSPEHFEISPEAADVLNSAKSAGRRIVAVGTTTTRALENCIAATGRFVAGHQTADLTITPGYRFGAIDALLTNFHLPQSSLLVLVSAFGGHELIMSAYRRAVASRFRFYSYGDCMFIH